MNELPSINIKKRLTTFQIIAIGFLGVILLGAIILMLPFSTSGNETPGFIDALFTATSAVCVTGLVVQDTSTYWSYFGQFIIITLIQIGGLGVITVAAAFTIISGRKISLMQRSTMQEAIAAPKVGGIVRLTGFIIKTTFLIELLGAAVMAPVFVRDFGLKGIWMAVFHSISAFCNAGFDLLGVREHFSSLTSYSADPVINITIMLLIIIGGIGFLTWDDIRTNGIKFHIYRMQSKVIFVTTAILILLPALFFYFHDFTELKGMERVLVSFFQSVTPRTAGYNTIDLGLISEAGLFIMIVLMLIGGSPGSTAGGMKATTIAVLFANAAATFKRKENAHFFGRRIDDDVVKNAATILIMYIVLCLTGAFIISVKEDLPILTCMYEAASAVGTVGLTLGITPTLSTLSKIVLIILMFLGRVGGLTLIFAAMSGVSINVSRLPKEKITVG